MDNGNTNISPELQSKLDQIKLSSENMLKPKKNTAPLIALAAVLILVSIVCIVFTSVSKGKNRDAAKDEANIATTQSDDLVEAEAEMRSKIDACISALKIEAENLFKNLTLTDEEKRIVTANTYNRATKHEFTTAEFEESYDRIFGGEVEHKTISGCKSPAKYDEKEEKYTFTSIDDCEDDDFEFKMTDRKYEKTDDGYTMSATISIDSEALNYLYSFDKDFHFVKIEKL